MRGGVSHLVVIKKNHFVIFNAHISMNVIQIQRKMKILMKNSIFKF